MSQPTRYNRHVPDPVPDRTKRLATLIGYMFHPFALFAPATLIVMRDEDWQTALMWFVIVTGIVLPPIVIVVGWVKSRHQKEVYQRTAREPIYLVGWLAMLVALGVLMAFDAPKPLQASVAAAALWIPLQMAVNYFYTKISAHAAVSMGIVTGLAMLGALDRFPWWLAGVAIVLLTGWARIQTRDHTPQQVILGWLVAGTSVLVMFALVL